MPEQVASPEGTSVLQDASRLRTVAVGSSSPPSRTGWWWPPGSGLCLIGRKSQLGGSSTGPPLLGELRGDGDAHRIDVRMRRSDLRSPQIPHHRSGRLPQQHGQQVTRRSAARSPLLRRFIYAIAIDLSVVFPLPLK
ncbi:uncharacterized protein LOC144104141 [Amblyomma americanum]